MREPGEPDVSPLEAARAALEAFESGGLVVAVVVIESTTEGPATGSRLLVRATGTRGTFGNAELDRWAAERAGELMQTGTGAITEAFETEHGPVTLYFEVFRPQPELVIVGAGHIARPLCTIGALLGFRVTVLDDRPAFATRERFPEAQRVLIADFGDPFREVPLGPQSHLVLVTRGHKYDYDALLDLMRRGTEVGYVGMVGSQRRVRAALEQLARQGIPRERLARIYSPIGLDVRAETPEEIAVAIAGEIIRVRRGGSGESLRDRVRVVERWRLGEDPAEPSR